MCLLPLRRLQAMLDVAEEDVCRFEIPFLARLDEVELAQLAQRGERVARAERQLRAAVDQLEDLREQLHFTDTAAPLLHVVVEVAMLRVLAVGSLLVSRQLFNGGLVQVLAVDERRDPFDERRAQLRVACDRPRLQQREPLERLAHRLVVMDRLLQRIHQRTTLTERTEPHVDAVEVALGGVLAQQRGQPAAQLLVALVRLVRPRIVIASRQFVDVDQVDVGAVVQVAATQVSPCR